ncbi:hypothetical protein SXCC_02988 [Gluconacetobacter sp. SXCC-1]|nr:hypothetical protein SXCC_02988 [Gluconacetobacter sp. SXCC-1]
MQEREILSEGKDLSRRQEIMADETSVTAVSMALAMKVATRFRLGRLRGTERLARDVGTIIAGRGAELSISVTHASICQTRATHRFDRTWQSGPGWRGTGPASMKGTYGCV